MRSASRSSGRSSLTAGVVTAGQQKNANNIDLGLLSSHTNSAFHAETNDQEAIFKNFIDMYSKQIKTSKKGIGVLRGGPRVKERTDSKESFGNDKSMVIAAGNEGQLTFKEFIRSPAAYNETTEGGSSVGGFAPLMQHGKKMQLLEQ